MSNTGSGDAVGAGVAVGVGVELGEAAHAVNTNMVANMAPRRIGSSH
jgi:hypothetical protein